MGFVGSEEAPGRVNLSQPTPYERLGGQRSYLQLVLKAGDGLEGRFGDIERDLVHPSKLGGVTDGKELQVESRVAPANAD